MTAGEQRTLITGEQFHELARKGIKPADLVEYSVMKAGLIDRSAIKAGPAPDRHIGFIMSNAHLDREGDSIAPKGWDLGHYLKNPVVLWAHDHGGLPVGKAVKAYLDTDDQLKSVDEFAGRDLYAFADTVYRMLQEGFLNACSVGFQPSEWEMSDTGVNFSKQSLLEHSVCPVPAHPEALTIARSKGIDTTPLREWAEQTLDFMRSVDRPGSATPILRKQAENFRALADPSGRKLFALGGVKVAGAIEDFLDIEDALVVEEAVSASVEDVLADVKDAPPNQTPGTVAVTDPDPAEVAEENAYAAMGAMLQAVGTACSMAMDAVNTLMTTPEPSGGDAEEETIDRSNLTQVASACLDAAAALTTVGTMAQTLLSKLPSPPPDDATDATEPPPVPPKSAEAGPERWNKRLSKAFDVARVRIEASSVAESLVAKYFGVALKHVERRSTTVPSFRLGSWLTAIDNEVASWQVDDVRNLDWKGLEVPPSYDTIQLNSTLSSDFMIDGIRFMRQETDGVELRMVLRLEPHWYGMDVTVYGVREVGTAGHVLGAVAYAAKGLNFLKGEAFALCGDFIPKTSETFDDLFLSRKNTTAATRIVKLVNERGAGLENRGVLLMGPAGTGKTLLARITRNLAEATFIWISSRDFHYAGTFGGITEAFDLARECAPSIIVFEDIDNWLTSSTMDLLKTELDGVGRSSGVVTMMTTNYPEMLPAALLDRPGRFHDVLRFGLPDATERRAMLTKWIAGLDAASLEKAVKATEGYSGAHVRELARFAQIIGEQEELDLPTSVERALAKLAEQKELINQTLTQGSRYRASADISSVRKVVKVPPAVPDAPAHRPGAHDGQWPPHREPRALQASDVPIKRPDPSAPAPWRQRHDDLMSCASNLLNYAELTAQQRTAVAGVQRSLMSIWVDKVGRVLSGENEGKIRKAATLLQEVLAQVEAPAEAVDAELLPAEPSSGPMSHTLSRGHVLVLDDEAEPVSFAIDVDPNSVLEAVSRAVSEQIMLHTGRVE